MIKKNITGDPRPYKGRCLSVNRFLCPHPTYTLQEQNAINTDFILSANTPITFHVCPMLWLWMLKLSPNGLQTYITVQFALTFFPPPTNIQLLQDTMHRYLIFSQNWQATSLCTARDQN